MYAFAVYTLKATNRRSDFLAALAEHAAVLLSEKLRKPRAPLVLEAKDGTLIEGVEWVSPDAAKQAHENPRVQAIWERLGQFAVFRALADVSDFKTPFAHTTVVDLPTAEPQLVDSMIAATDFERLKIFYRDALGLTTVTDTASFATYATSLSGQALCITNGPSLKKAGLSFVTRTLGDAARRFQEAGGTIESSWEFGLMKGVNGRDPEGNEVMLFELVKG